MAVDKRPSKKVGSVAGHVLADPKSSATDKKLAASLLANMEPKKKLVLTLKHLNAKKGH